MISLEYLLAVLIVVLTPGTGVIYVLSVSLNNTQKESIYAAFGCTLGILPHIILLILSLLYMIDINEHVFKYIGYLGILYLLYLSYKLYTTDVNMKLEKANNKQIVINAVLINLLNPKLFIFLLAFVPQFINIKSQDIYVEVLNHCIVFILITFIVFIFYGLIAQNIKKLFIKTDKFMSRVNKLFSLLYILICVKLLQLV